MAQAVLSAIFKGVDEISSTFDKMANSGVQALDSFTATGTAMSDTMEKASSGADSAAKAMENAATSTDHWTEALGNYDREALEFMHTTEELVALGFKTEAALESVSDSAENVGESLGELGSSVDEASRDFEELGNEAENAGDTVSEAIGAIGSAIVAAGIAKLVREITAAVTEKANEFSRAESIIVKSGGATGQELARLRDSAVNVWSGVPESTESVATVLGTLNTATGSVGEELEHLTNLSLQFARVNNEDAAASASTLGRLMNALDADVSELASTMDQLTLASQMSGLGVNAMAEYIIAAGPSFEEMGFGVERSIALFSSFYQAGAEPRELLSSLNILLNRMAQDGLTNAEEAFDELIDSIYAAPDILSATVIASEAFGARVGAKVADDIRAGRFAIDDWVDAVSNSQGTLAATAEAALTVEERWAQASSSIEAAFVGVLAPATNNVSEAFADLVENVGEFLQENPELVAAMSALAAVFGLAGAGVMAFVAASTIKAKVLTPLTLKIKAFGIATNAAIWPLTLMVGAIAGVVAIATVLITRMNAAEDSFTALSASSREQYKELQALEARYEETVATFGETSTEAQLLRAEIDDLSESFERNRITHEDFMANMQAAAERYSEMVESLTETREVADAGADSIMNLVVSLETLMGQTSRTAAEQQQVLGIVDLLNQRVPNLALVYDAYSDSLNLCAEAIRTIAQAEADRLVNVAKYDELLERTQQQTLLDNEATAALNEKEAAVRALAAAEQAHYDAVNADFWDHFQIAAYADAIWDARERVDELTEAHEQAAGRAENNAGWINYLSGELANYSAEQARAAAEQEEMNRQLEMGSNAIHEVMERVQELTEAYNLAKEAALQSISSQFSMWDEVSETAAKSVETVTERMEAQRQHWEAYRGNIDTLNDVAGEFEGLSEMVASFADGSQDSIDMIAGMAEALESGDTEAIESMITTWEALQAEQEATAASLADLATDFSNQIDEMSRQLNQAVREMDLGPEAAEHGMNTMRAYIDAILAMEGAVRDAFQRVANAGVQGLSGVTIPAPSFSVDGSNADGLDYVPFDGYISELHKGERVLTAEENTRYSFAEPFLEALSNLGGGSPITITPPLPVSANPVNIGTSDSESRSEIKVVEVRVGSNGDSIRVEGNVDKDAVLELLQANMKPVLLNIIEQEVFEEGDGSYDF